MFFHHSCFCLFGDDGDDHGDNFGVAENAVGYDRDDNVDSDDDVYVRPLCLVTVAL